MFDVLKATLCATWRTPCVAVTTIHQLDLKKVFMVVVLENKMKNQVFNSEFTKLARQQHQT